MMSAFKRAFKAFLQATQEGIEENVREQEQFAQDVLDQADRLEQTAPQQTQAAT